MRIGVEEQLNPANHNYSSGNMCIGVEERSNVTVRFSFRSVRSVPISKKTLNTDQSAVSVSVTDQNLFGNTESSREIPLTNMRKNHYHEKEQRSRERESNAESGEFFFLCRSIIITRLTQ